MSINHHPSDATLMSYAAGALDEGLALVVATHLSGCAAFRRKVADMEAIGGVLLEEMEPAAMAPDALERVMARLDAEEPRAEVSAPAARGKQGTVPDPTDEKAIILPEPLRRYLEQPVQDSHWRRVAPGIRQIEVLPRAKGRSSVRLLRIAPGTHLPRHGHGGLEMTLVISGSYADELGRFRAGDLAELDQDVQHQPIADADVDCICLVATQGPLRFSGIMERLMQPLIGI